MCCLLHSFAFIKPDAVAANYTDSIMKRVQNEGCVAPFCVTVSCGLAVSSFEVTNEARLTLSTEQAQEFYAEHKDKGFFAGLIEFMTRCSSQDLFTGRLTRRASQWSGCCACAAQG